jgi:hypothetical protein
MFSQFLSTNIRIVHTYPVARFNSSTLHVQSITIYFDCNYIILLVIYFHGKQMTEYNSKKNRGMMTTGTFLLWRTGINGGKRNIPPPPHPSPEANVIDLDLVSNMEVLMHYLLTYLLHGAESFLRS